MVATRETSVGYIGIDPGFGGAIALLREGPWRLDVWDMPVAEPRKGRKQHLPAVLAEILRDALAHSAVVSATVEQMGARPEQGIVSTGRLMEGYGMIQGVLATLGVATDIVPPARWKTATRTPGDKALARQRASLAFPTCAGYWRRAKDADRAEAAMIAVYGALSAGLTPRDIGAAVPGDLPGAICCSLAV